MKTQAGKGIKSSAKANTARTQKKSGELPEEKIIGDDLKDDDIKSSANNARNATATSKLDDEDDDLPEEADAWEKPQEDDDENWDPDFDEFDVPKSGGKGLGKKGGKEDDDDFKVDDEFKDMFDDSGFDDKVDDDY